MILSHSIAAALYMVVLAASPDPSASTASWPQWRGPYRDGILRNAPAWPDSLSGEHLVQVWRVELGPSYSGPIVTADRVFVTETLNKKSEVVRALDRASGKQLWEARWSGAVSVPFFAKASGDWIRATPACDGRTLYVAGMQDVLVALDVATGAERWRVDLAAKFKAPEPAFGFVCSPLVLGDFVYVQAGSGFIKLNKHTGEVLWRSLVDEGGLWGSAFSSPMPAEIRDQPQILVQTRTRLVGVDPATGDEYWSREIPAFRGMNILTPTVYDNAVFTSSYGGKTLLVQIDRQANAFTAEPAWVQKSQGYMSSPVILGSHAYLHLKNQRFTCIDLRTGEQRWTTTPFGQYWSLVANGEKLLALDERGSLYLVRENPDKYEQLDFREVSESPTWAHLAVCGDELFIRELNAIAVYRWR